MDYHSGDSLTGFFGFEGTKKGPTSLKILIINYHANSRSKRCDLMTDYIKNILQIKDPNLHFTDVVFENNDGWETQVFHWDGLA
jgi:hypothetical protein